METIQRTSSICFPMLGDWTINPPSYITILGRNIYFYGIIISLGFIFAIWYCSKNSRKFGLTEDDVFDLVIWLIPLGILGARLYFVAFKAEYYLAHPSEILAIHNGGLAIYGGIIAGILVLLAVCKKKKLKFLAMLDLIIFGLLLGQIMGRWGNFMNREAFGAETEIFCRMGLIAPDGSAVYVHPTFLYESLWNLVCFVFLIVWTNKGKRKYDGQVALIYFFWYGVGRTWIEGLRTDSLYIGNTGIRVSQALSLVLAVAAGAALLIQSRRKHDPNDMFVNKVPAAEPEISETEE